MTTTTQPQPWERDALLPALHDIAPSIVITITHEPDDDGFYNWNEEEWGPAENYECYRTTVTATVILNGEFVTASAYLGCSYEKFGEPKCPEIHGYLPQMIEEAITELRKTDLPGFMTQYCQAGNAIAHLRSVLQQRYDHDKSCNK